MESTSTLYIFAMLGLNYISQVHGTSCLVVECWFVQEKPGHGGFPVAMRQEKSLMFVRMSPNNLEAEYQLQPPAGIDSSRVYHVIDPSASLCSSSLHSPEGSVKKPQCEINPFLPQLSIVKWAAPLTGSGQSPVYLEADWFSASLRGLDEHLVLSTVMRAEKTFNELNVILSVSSTSALVRSRLGVPVALNCRFWMESSSPLSEQGFAVEWRYQFRGAGRLIVAYDAKNDRLAETSEQGVELDISALHQTGNASLLLEEAQVRHTGTYICSIYLPYLLAQVAIDLEIVEPPSLFISPSPLPTSFPGQTLTVQCEASGFSPLSLEFHWEFVGMDGTVQPLGKGAMSGHRQAADGTFSQSSRLTLDLGKVDLGQAGEVTCVAVHPGGTRRTSTTLNIIGVTGPTIEDSMAMVAVALGLYGLIKLCSWMLSRSGSIDSDSVEKKVNSKAKAFPAGQQFTSLQQCFLWKSSKRTTKPNSVRIPSLTRTSTTHLGEPPSWPHYTPKEPCQSLRVEDFPFFNVSQDDRARNFSRRRFSRECSTSQQYPPPIPKPHMNTHRFLTEAEIETENMDQRHITSIQKLQYEFEGEIN